MNFNHKLQKLQTNLDMWRARDLTLFGRVLIIKSLGLPQLIYSVSNLDVPQEIISTIKTKLFNFLWKNKRDAAVSLDSTTFDSGKEKLENGSRLLPRKIWRFEISPKVQL